MQEIVHGIGHLRDVMGARAAGGKVLLVTDASYPFLSIKDDVEALPIQAVPFSGFTSNPVFEDVCQGVRLCLDEGCEAILAIGGGSAIDVAKCIKLAVLAEAGIRSLIPPLVSSRVPADGSRLPLIAIPTTAGTGSESTHNAVMYYEGAKQTVTNDAILPDVALLEPAVLQTLPLYQKKCTLLDALCQGIESWWSVHSTDESKAYARTAVETIIAHADDYLTRGDAAAAAHIMLAANYAGRAINISATTAPHAMSYKLTSLYHLPHGHAVALCLPEVWDYMLAGADACTDPRGADYLLRTFDDIAHAMRCSSPAEAVAWFRSLLEKLEMGRPQSTRPDEELTLLSRSVNPVRLRNNPVPIDETQARTLYAAILAPTAQLKIDN